MHIDVSIPDVVQVRMEAVVIYEVRLLCRGQCEKVLSTPILQRSRQQTERLLVITFVAILDHHRRTEFEFTEKHNNLAT